MRSYMAGFIGIAAAAAAVALSAQTTTPPGAAASAATDDSAVGVTTQEATEANRQAVPRPDTGTVVRTGPDAGDRAREAAGAAAEATRDAAGATADAAREATSDTADTTRDAASGTTPGASPGSMDSGTSSTRPARADRN